VLSSSELREVLSDLAECGILSELGARKFYIAHPINVYILASYYAKSLEDPLFILDVGCNIGYGSRVMSHLLSKKGRKFKIVGIDIDNNALSIARKFSPQIEFKLIDILNSDNIMREFNRESFNIIIASEVIEHLPREYMKKFFENMEYLLKEDGILIISTPEKYTYDLFAYTEDHINEMTISELRRFIEDETRFAIVDHLGTAFNKIAIIKLLTQAGMSARYNEERRKFNLFTQILRGAIFNILFPIFPDSLLMRSLPFDDITKMLILMKRRYLPRRVEEALARGEIPTFQIVVLRRKLKISRKPGKN
jgi:2-polyprenyl-3-methyl-5-hydroxy-6-metoxy-1,4-benzoquinol methylase